MSDADVLLAAMTEYVAPDGTFSRNLNVVAAEIGWSPAQLDEVIAEAVADGRIERVVEDPAYAGNPRWLLLDALVPVSLDDMTVAELRAHADANGIDLGGATKKADVRAAIDSAVPA